MLLRIFWKWERFKILQFIIWMWCNCDQSSQKITYYNWHCHHHKYFQWVFKKGIIKSDLSDHLSIFFSNSTSKLPQKSSPPKHKKRFFNESNLESFKNQISNINRDILNSTQCSANNFYETFLNIFSEIYDLNFPLTEIEIKPKKLKTPWFCKRLKKSSKTKQRLYIKFLSNKSSESEEKYKNYKILFEKLKVKSKKNCYASC